jgi:hypothetical protein
VLENGDCTFRSASGETVGYPTEQFSSKFGASSLMNFSTHCLHANAGVENSLIASDLEGFATFHPRKPTTTTHENVPDQLSLRWYRC